MRTFRNILSAIVGLVVLAVVPLPAVAASRWQLGWDSLGVVIGKTVFITMPGGEAISGVAIGLEPDALLVNVKKTSDARAYPKGALRVSRATLRVILMQKRTSFYRPLATTLGVFAGAIAGAAAQYGIDGCFEFSLNFCRVSTAGNFALAGLTAAGAVGGYYAGKAADTRRITIEILP